MVRLLRKHFSTALVFIGLFLMSGCSGAPTAPGPDSRAGRAPRSLATTSSDEASDPSPGTVASGVSTTRQINGLLGGLVRAGRFSVVIPSGAFVGVALITVRQPDPSRLVCELEISPASKNKFLVPVQLIADCKGMPSGTLLSTSFISWYDPATAKWVRVEGSSVNLLSLSVQAPLWHFSKYRVEDGKAGW